LAEAGGFGHNSRRLPPPRSRPRLAVLLSASRRIVTHRSGFLILTNAVNYVPRSSLVLDEPGLVRWNCILCANLFPEEALTRASLTRRSPRDYAGPPFAQPLPMHFCFGGGNALKNGMERQGSGGNGSNLPA